MTLHFPSWDALQFALTSRLLPDDIVRQPGHLVVGPKSDIWFEPRQPLTTSIESLSSFGISVNGQMPATTHVAVDHLWQAVPLVGVGNDAAISTNLPVLFVVNNAQQLSTFINELLRLGNDRIGIRSFDESYLVLVQGPPYYSLLPSLDRNETDPPHAFIEQAPRFWVAIGWQYPLAQHIVVTEDQLVLAAPPHDWTVIAADKFRDVADCLEIAAPSKSVSARPAEFTEPWNIDLQPTPASTTEPATLWVIRENVLPQLDALVQSIDAAIVDRFSFALTEADGETIGVVRLRPSRSPRPNVEIAGEPFRAYLRIPNLFVPTTHRLQPPLHRETMRKLLAADANILHVVSASKNGTFEIEAFSESAFRPLSNYIDEVLRRDRDALNEWALATQFAFAELTQEEVHSEAASPTAVAKPAVAKPKSGEDDVRAKSTGPLTRQRARPSLTPPTTSVEIPKSDANHRTQLAAVEEHFVNLGGELNSLQRRALWPQLARLNAELRQPAEAAIAWNHALWYADSFADEQLWGWVWAEKALQEPELTADDIGRLMSPATPTPSEVRVFASVLTWAGQRTPIPAVLRQALPQLQSYLQLHEHLLPIRAVWLAWLSWCRAAGGDALTLARARDRLLTRLLERGLNPEVDLPSFLRFAGREDGDRLRAVRGWIEEIREKVRQWYFRQTHVDARTDPTAAYIDLLFAMGFARLGESATARNLMKQAESILTNITGDTADAHDFLLQAFVWRVEEVLAGRSAGGPLPPEMLDYLAQLHLERDQLPKSNEYEVRRLVPYVIERLREQLRILEPQEKFDPYRQTRRESLELITLATKLPDIRNPQLLQSRINELVRDASRKPELLVRILAESVAVAGRLGADGAGKLLDRVLPALDAAPNTNDVPILETRLRLVERSLFFAAHFDRSDLVPGLIERLMKLLESDSAKDLLDSSNYAVSQTLMSLRKLGLRDESLNLLDRLAKAVLRNRTLEGLTNGPTSAWGKPLIPLLHVAAGWNCLEQTGRAAPILVAAKRLLNRNDRSAADKPQALIYVQVLCNTIMALGHLPANEARTQIAEFFTGQALDELPNTFTSRTFYSRFHLNVAEAVVLALASHEFALGSAARHWLDEDEYLIRQRVHRDVRAAVGRG